MSRRVMFAVLVFALILFLPVFAVATPGPRAYLIEQVRASYGPNGAPDSNVFTGCDPGANPCRYGYFQVSVPNPYDVLQEVRLNVSTNDKTTLRYGVGGESYVAYKSTVSSPNGGHSDPQTLYVNTSDSVAADQDYGITDSSVAPVIQLNATITNWQGGYDLYDADNIGSGGDTNVLNFTLNITNPGTTTLSGVTVSVQFAKDTGPTGQDAVNISSVPTSGGVGTPGRQDTDSDNFYDKATWTGDLSGGNSVLLTFNITIKEGVNFADGTDNLNLDQGTEPGAHADYGSTGTFTGITINTKFSKGPIRQGIDMALQSGGGSWLVRGFIRNMANQSEEPNNHLTYNVTYWKLYEVSATTGEPDTVKKSGNYSNGAGYLLKPSDGRLYTTDPPSSDTTWYNTGSSTKPYFASYFDWQVVWNGTYYYRYVNTTYNLTILYKIDMSNEKQVSGYINPEQGGDVLTVTDTAQHTGNENAPAKFVHILSVVPVNTTAGSFHGNFTINTTSIKVYFVNATKDYELSGGYTQSVTQPSNTGANNGLVNITITDVSAATLSEGGTIGHNLNPNEKIKLVYDVISHKDMTVGDQYNFTGNSTMKTPSGTPLTKAQPSVIVSVSSKRLIGYKDLVAYDPNHPEIINVTIVLEAQTNSTDNKIAGIKFIDYVPNSTDIDHHLDIYKGRVKVYYRENSTASWVEWTEGTDYDISDNGTFTIGNVPVAAYEFYNASGDGWYLGNGGMINVTYWMNVSEPGLYAVPVIISGFDPLTGESISARGLGVIRVTLPKAMKPLEMEEGKFQQAKRAVVGRSVLWMKDFTVYNPNSVPVKARFEIDTFGDTEKGYATYYDESGKKIEEPVDFDVTPNGKTMFWESTIQPYETRNYEIRILTPPIIEVDRDVSVLEKLENKKVKIKMDIYLKNFGKEDYKNVVLNLPISYEDILNVRDSFGNMLQFTGGEDSSSIIVGYMKSEEIKTITVIYKQSYPTVIVTPRKEEYRAGRPVGLDILVINGGEKVEYPYLEVEIYTPGMDVIATDMKQLESMEPLKKTELTEEYFIPISAPTGMYLASASFRENFVTLARGTGRFYVVGGGSETARAIEILIVLIVLIGSGVLVYKRVKVVKEDLKEGVK
ncbi:MAG: hypothetical protein J7L45_03570 [Candidatus Aenigmarchaeota archaeon]|nr:hypothetical protein [Candidatus Aenigmarchaeota archaeon]